MNADSLDCERSVQTSTSGIVDGSPRSRRVAGSAGVIARCLTGPRSRAATRLVAVTSSGVER
jgi:hypothetical protein